MELRARHHITPGCLPVRPLFQFVPHCRGGDVLHRHELLDSEDLAGDVWRMSVVDCLQSPVDSKRLERALDVLGEGDGGAAEGDAEVGVRLRRGGSSGG